MNKQMRLQMVMDDTAWFESQKRAKREMSMEYDEWMRILAKPVRSEFEMTVRKEIEEWMKKQPPEKCWATPAQAYDEFWKEKLN
jgi:hypothetical protein